MKTKICTKCGKRKKINQFYTSNYYCKSCTYQTKKDWRLKHRKRHNIANRKSYRQCKVAKLKYNQQPHIKLARNLRTRINLALKEICKSAHTFELLGCTLIQLVRHLEKQFKKGMTWKNYGTWHVDHIKPLSKFNLANPKQQKLACNYKNLQPLWANENLSKSNKVGETR